MSTTRVNNLGNRIDANNLKLIEEAPSQRAAVKIQKLFLDGVRYDISQRHVNKKKAFGGKVLELTVEPKYVGKRAAYQISYLIMNAYKALLKELPPNVNFAFQSVFEFQSNRHGDTSYATSKVYQERDTAKWATPFTEEIYKLAQSEEELKFKNFNVRFFIGLDLSGGVL
jgi:hypothetical protein